MFYLLSSRGVFHPLFLFVFCKVVLAGTEIVNDTAAVSPAPGAPSLSSDQALEDYSEEYVYADTSGAVEGFSVVVTASRRQRLLEASQSLSVIRPEEWAGTGKSIADVVAEQTGVQTRRYGGTGSYQTTTIRGVQGDRVLVLLDGIPLNSVMGGAVDLGAINVDRFSSIEIYKGITPGEFGGNSIGGVVNLKSKSASDAQTSSVQTSVGAYGYKKFGMESNHHFSDQLSLFGSLNYVESDNNWPYCDRNKTPYNLQDDVIRKVENHSYSLIEARLHPSLNLPGGRKLLGGVALTKSQVGIPASEGSANRTATHSHDVVSATLRMSEEESSDISMLTFTPEIGYLQWADNTFWTSLDQNMGTSHGRITSAPNSFGEMKSALYVSHASGTADIYLLENLGGQITVQGRYSAIATRTRVSGFPHGDWPGNRQEAAFTADLNNSLPVGSLTLGATAGGSLKAIRSATKGGRNDVLEITVKPTVTVELPWAAHAGIRLGMDNRFNLFMNAARYSNVPGLRDKYGTKGTVTPNPDLKEETGTTIETGLRLLHEDLWFEATAFRTKTHNGIIMLSDGSMAKPVNLAEARTVGLETTISTKPCRYLKSEIRATLQEAVNLSGLYNYNGKQLPNEPRFSMLAKVVLGPFWGMEPEYWIDYKSHFFRDYGNTQRVPEKTGEYGLAFHNARITWKLGESFNAGLSIRNFNSQSLRYEEITRSPESGYSWILYPANEWSITTGYSF
ncbi:MAG: TonB-dependent receptor [Chitinispirillaceae bacterium]